MKLLNGSRERYLKLSDVMRYFPSLRSTYILKSKYRSDSEDRSNQRPMFLRWACLPVNICKLVGAKSWVLCYGWTCQLEDQSHSFSPIERWGLSTPLIFSFWQFCRMVGIRTPQLSLHCGELRLTVSSFLHGFVFNTLTLSRMTSESLDEIRAATWKTAVKQVVSTNKSKSLARAHIFG